MPPRKWIDKKKADTYTLVYRSQEDPLYHDPDASERVLVKVDNLNNAKQKQERRDKWAVGPTSSKVLTRDELEREADEFKTQGRRDNEGEAALYGIQFDDSKYDYMQHLKSIGDDPGAVYIARKGALRDTKASKEKDLVLKADYAAANRIELPSEALPSEQTVKRTYQDQQNVPDELAGLQPDIDPSLREVLEALEDEEFVDNDDILFDELIQGGKAEPRAAGNEWDDFDPDDFSDAPDYSDDEYAPPQSSKQVVAKEGEQDWETAFRQFKIDQTKQPTGAYGSSGEEEDDDVASLPQISTAPRKGGKKKRGGAGTDLTSFSMSSSALVRNAGLTLLDDRFDKVEAEYNTIEEEDEEEYQPFDMAKERDDFEDIMDDFLDNYVVEGKKMFRK